MARPPYERMNLYSLRKHSIIFLVSFIGLTQSPAHAVVKAIARSAHASSVIVTGRTTIYVSESAPGPVLLAVKDLTSDFKKVFGIAPRVVHHRAEATPTSIVIGEASKLPAGMLTQPPTARESFTISVQRAKQTGENPKIAIVLAGADMRGTIYAIYQFSQEFLGVDPMYYWTDHEPERRLRVDVPAAFQKTYGPPVFRYRGFFTNDEDLLAGWAPGAKDHSEISLAVWNKIFETILRLKGNMVVPGTWIFPNDPQVKLAAERGLILAEHHATPLGVNVARWPYGVPYNYTLHPEILDRAWTDAVNEYPADAEVLWTVGLRGLSDQPYSALDPSVRGNNKALGRVISEAMAKQVSIVRAVHPNAEFITNLWMEGDRLMRSGDLKIPAGVHVVWADTGYGNMQDNGEVRAGEGAYFHVAMMNGRANHLTEGVPVERIYSELGRYIRAGATFHILVNTSCIRPVAMTTEAIMNTAWGGAPPAAVTGAQNYYRRWSAEEFGPRAASPVAKVYQDYFAAPAGWGRPLKPDGDQFYQTEARRLMLTYMIHQPLYVIPSQSPKWTPPSLPKYELIPGMRKKWFNFFLKMDIQQCEPAEARWNKVWQEALAARPLVLPSRRNFYQADVLTMITINRESNRMLVEIAKAILDAKSGETVKAREHAAQALDALRTVRAAQQAAEYGKWKHWYRGDWLVGVRRTQQMAETFSKFLVDPETSLPPPIAGRGGWEAYYHIMDYEDNRSVDVR